ncbi:MAG: carboxy terminal-processing peptidase, partial [Deltaproteobacteria bacterium]|nr:carboxy terminal-processing peptidase [Kofleriaceae bacterium]
EAKARADLAKAYSGRFARLRAPGKLDAAADLVNAVAAAYDPHTSYLPPADEANFNIQMTGSLEGIGAVLREKDHHIEVVELVPGGASWRDGRLDPGDLILSVANEREDAVDVVDMPLDQVVKMIRGPKGTVVRLQIQKATGVQQIVAITRDVVVIEEAFARGAVLQAPGARAAYGYIFLPSFYGGRGPDQRTAAADVSALLADLKARKVEGVVIDMRGNGGGYLGDAVAMAGALIDRGPVVQIEDARGRREVLSDDEPGTAYDGPVVLLVDRFSASAAEIVAGALQDYRRAVVVGTSPTHGKGTVQSVIDLDRFAGKGSDLGVFKVTVQQFFRVSGASTQREGVTPDVILPDPFGHLETGERTLDHAVPWKQIDAAPHAAWSGRWDAAALTARSATRVAKDKGFARIVTLARTFAARAKDTRVPLARAAYDEYRKAQRDALAAGDVDQDKAPQRFAVKLLAEEALAAPAPGGKVDDRLSRWKTTLARDSWVAESLRVLDDMRRK